MIDQCGKNNFEAIYEIVNDAAQMYKGIIPANCWKEPYMSKEELQHEIACGVIFWGYKEEGKLLGVMGLQNLQDVNLIRHAYVRKANQNKGIGSQLLKHLLTLSHGPILIGTWRDATWAVSFYEKHGFQMVSSSKKDRLLNQYWEISQEQTENSVVLADQKWFNH